MRIPAKEGSAYSYDQGIRINYGETLGKTIIFAKNHDHAEKILEIFGKEYPNLPDMRKSLIII